MVGRSGGTVMANWNVIDYFTISSTGNAVDFGNMTEASRYAAATSNGTNDRGVCFGGADSGRANIDYITITSTGNAGDFGDLINSYAPIMAGACSNMTNDRGVCGGGNSSANHIQYITITSTGNATDFGDLTIGREANSAVSNGTQERGVFGSGNPSGASQFRMDYITINSTGNATVFGSKRRSTRLAGGFSDCGT